MISPAEEESKRQKLPKTSNNWNWLNLRLGKSISKDETKSLVMYMGHRLTAVIVPRDLQLNNSF